MLKQSTQRQLRISCEPRGYCMTPSDMPYLVINLNHRYFLIRIKIIVWEIRTDHNKKIAAMCGIYRRAGAKKSGASQNIRMVVSDYILSPQRFNNWSFDPGSKFQ